MAGLIVGSVLVVGVAPGVVRAGEVNLGASSKIGYDSNVFSRSSDVDGGDIETAVIQLNAFGQVSDELERGTYMARYQPSYFINTASGADNTWNHHAIVKGEYIFSHRTRVRVTDTFRFLEKISYDPEGPPDPNIDDRNRRTITNDLGLGFSHMLTKFTAVYGNGTYIVNRYNRSTDEDNELLSANAGLQHALTRRLTLGAGGRVSYRTFDSQKNPTPLCGGGDGPGSRTLSYSGFGFLSFLFDETMSVNVQAGPARIDSTNYFCGLVIPPMPSLPFTAFLRSESDQTTWFASGELLKRWKRVKGSLRYLRSEGLGGVGTTTVNDTLALRLDWTPARHWAVGARASWIHRSQDTADARQSSQDSTTWTTSGSVSKQVAKRTRLSLQISYRKNDPEGGGGSSNNSGRDFDILRVFVGVKYEFDPIRF